MSENKHIRVYMLALGCSKNLVDAECMLSYLKEDGFELVDDITAADVAVINTCGFIESAKKEAIDAILSASDYKKPEGNLDFVVATGCLAQRYAQDIKSDLPEVDLVLGTSQYQDIARAIRGLYGDGSSSFDVEAAGGISHLRNDRTITTTGYAWLKIAEGCLNRCSFCAIPIIRGKYVSRPMEEIISEARNIASQGYKELILAAQDTTNYGIDIYGKRSLPSLLRELVKIDSIETIRVMYGYMDGIDDELIDVISGEPKICNYLDIPIQHGDDGILKAMRRRDTADKITEVLGKLRDRIPDVIIRTTVLVGFPGETEEAFKNLLDNLKKWRFDRLGCFAFSPEEGTAAYDMDGQIDEKTKQERVARVYEVQREISAEHNRSRLNSVVKVTIDSISDDGIFYRGRSYGEAPEVDPEIFVAASERELTIGESYDVKIVDCSDYELTGVTI